MRLLIAEDEKSLAKVLCTILEKNGFTVLKELRASGNRIPVLFLTARSEVNYGNVCENTKKSRKSRSSSGVTARRTP